MSTHFDPVPPIHESDTGTVTTLWKHTTIHIIYSYHTFPNKTIHAYNQNPLSVYLPILSHPCASFPGLLPHPPLLPQPILLLRQPLLLSKDFSPLPQSVLLIAEVFLIVFITSFGGSSGEN
jgi:hypothetical protein